MRPTSCSRPSSSRPRRRWRTSLSTISRCFRTFSLRKKRTDGRYWCRPSGRYRSAPIARGTPTRPITRAAEGYREPLLPHRFPLRGAVGAAWPGHTPDTVAPTATDEGEGATIHALIRVGEEALAPGPSRLPPDNPVCIIAEGIPEPL